MALTDRLQVKVSWQNTSDQTFTLAGTAADYLSQPSQLEPDVVRAMESATIFVRPGIKITVRDPDDNHLVTFTKS